MNSKKYYKNTNIKFKIIYMLQVQGTEISLLKGDFLPGYIKVKKRLMNRSKLKATYSQMIHLGKKTLFVLQLLKIFQNDKKKKRKKVTS